MPRIPGPPLPPGRMVGLDGLRGVAAALIVFHHAGGIAGPARSAPFDRLATVADVGVAVFFVLSGLVVYRPFARAHATGEAVPATGAFLRRRALRVLPAYWFALICLGVLGLIEIDSTWEWIEHLTLTQVFDPAHAFDGIVPSWSLSVELCFYLSIPLISALLRRHGRRVTVRSEAGLVAALYLSGWLARGLLSLHEIGWQDSTLRGMSFLWLPTNIDLFAIGMAVAVWQARRPGPSALTESLISVRSPANRARRILAEPLFWWVLAGIVFVAYAYGVGPVDFNVGYRGWFWERRQLAYGAIGVLLVLPLTGTERTGALRRWLSLPVMLWLGMLSYGLYLWHHPWIVRVGTELSDHTAGFPRRFGSGVGDVWFPAALAVGFGLGLLGALAGWLAAERPTERWENARWPRHRQAPSAGPDGDGAIEG